MKTPATRVTKSNSYDRYLGPEDKTQIAVTEYLRLQYPKAVYHHSPNEGKRSRFEQYKIKKLGVKSGFPDLLILYKGVRLALELKKDKGDNPTDNQMEWLKAIRENGFTAAYAKGFDEAKKIIDGAFKGGN